MSARLYICLGLVMPFAAAQAASESVLYSFTAPPNGVRPWAPVISDAAGNFYGTTYTGARTGAGTVYEISPPANGKSPWTERVLHHFTLPHHGEYPESAALTFDSAGNLYGVTPQGSKNDAGLVFRLSPPANGAGKWAETVLYHFNGKKDGGTPYGSLILDAAGNLYGTTGYGGAHGAGTVFELSPGGSGAPWTETVLYSFTNGTDGGNPYCTLAADSSGNLFGTTLAGGNAGNGVVFELSPAKGGGWTEQVLHSFDSSTDGTFPRAGVILDGKGNLYGTTENGGTNNWGTVFEVSPPSGGTGAWSESVLYSFGFNTDGGNPGYGLLVQDSSGNLFGTTQVGGTPRAGTVFELSPPSKGGSAWSEKTVHSFAGTPDGGEPEAGLSPGPGGTLVGTTFQGGTNNQGTVFEVTP